MDKKRIIMIAISAVLLIAICLIIGISGVLSPYQRQIRLGYKLLEQGNYEEAILAFDKAIEIDVKRAKAYIGKVDVFVARCDENVLEDIKHVIKTGYMYHDDDAAIVESIINAADTLSEKEKNIEAIELLEFCYELTGNKTIIEKKQIIIGKFVESYMPDLYLVCESEDKGAVIEELKSKRFHDIIKYINNEEFKYFYFPDNNKAQTGKGLGLYYIENKTYGNIFIYYGDFINAERSGTGTWIAVKDENYYWFKGEWSEDIPNGKGIDQSHAIVESRGVKFEYTTEIQGNYVNGLLDGTFTRTDYSTDGKKIMSFENVVASNGVLQENGCGTCCTGDSYCVIKVVHKGGSQTHWTSKGELHGVVGFYRN